jgi:virginiamycin B lyase
MAYADAFYTYATPYSLNMTLRTPRAFLSKLALMHAVFVACLAACSSGGRTSSSLLPAEAVPAQAGTISVRANPAKTGPVPVTMTYAFGVSSTGKKSRAREHGLQSASYVGYTSTAAPISISLNVTPIGGSTANYTGSCTATASGTSGTCTVTFTALPGPTTFAGTLTESGNTVADFSQTSIVTPGSANAINFTSNPVVNSISLQLSAGSVNAGTPSNTLLTVNAYDANGKIIAGNAPYVDSSGNPVSFSLSVSNARAGGRGGVALQGPTLISRPGQGATYAHYDGNWLQSAAISAESSNNAITNVTNITLSITPMAYIYATSVSAPTDIVTGPDGNLWYQGAGKIGRITPAGVVTGFAVPSGSQGNYICVGPDGNIWFDELSNSMIGKITVGGTVTEYPTGVSATNYGGITLGPDGNLWFTSNGPDAINSLSTTGTVKTYAVGPFTLTPGGITVGPDGNLWSQDIFANTIVRTTLAGVSTQFSYAGGASLSQQGAIVTGPDGNLWFNSSDGHAIEVSTPNGVISRYTLGLSPSAQIDGLTVGPDGNVWFVDWAAASAIGMINIATKQSIEYTNGIPFNSQPAQLTVGPDGNLWATAYNGFTSQIMKFVY